MPSDGAYLTVADGCFFHCIPAGAIVPEIDPQDRWRLAATAIVQAPVQRAEMRPRSITPPTGVNMSDPSSR